VCGLIYTSLYQNHPKHSFQVHLEVTFQWILKPQRMLVASHSVSELPWPYELGREPNLCSKHTLLLYFAHIHSKHLFHPPPRSLLSVIEAHTQTLGGGMGQHTGACWHMGPSDPYQNIKPPRLSVHTLTVSFFVQSPHLPPVPTSI
jgi:hypothetical protein